MIDFVVVDYPSIWPQRCVICTNQKGSMLDTHAENSDGRVYICKSCLKRGSEKFGFAKGEELDKLMDITTQVETYEKGLEQKDEAIKMHRAKNAELQQALTNAQNETKALRGKQTQFEHYIKELQGVIQEIGMVGV